MVFAASMALTGFLARTPLAVPLTGRARVPWRLAGRLSAPHRSPGQGREPAGERGPGNQPGMTGIRPRPGAPSTPPRRGRAGRRRPGTRSARRVRTPPPPAAGSRGRTARPAPGRTAGRVAAASQHRQRRLAEQQRRVPEVVRGRCQQRGAPVEHRHPAAVGQQVERMQVTMADDVPGRPGRMTGRQRPASARSVRPNSAANRTRAAGGAGTVTSASPAWPSSPRTRSGSRACSRAIEVASSGGT